MLIRATKPASCLALFRQLYNSLPVPEGQTEPMLNIVGWREADEHILVVFPRSKHRPDCYYATGSEQMLISPGALDMAGLLITPRREDFQRLTQSKAIEILKEVSLPKTELRSVSKPAPRDASPAAAPTLSVGILSTDALDFHLNGTYHAKGETICGPQTVELAGGSLLWRGQQYQELCFTPIASQLPGSSFTLQGVTIGKGFHWEQQQEQTFIGTLRLIVEGDKLLAINELPLEDYIESVIASEMSADSHPELLKAHAVISRSWVLYQKEQKEKGDDKVGDTIVRKDGELLRWYNREEHTLFDVCADDHCQRYQGLHTAQGDSQSPAKACDAVRSTCGEVLTCGGQLCDTRFSKCCGGQTEEYQYCWDDTPKPYLRSISDPFCDTGDEQVLRQVLNDYDQPSIPSFHDWTVEYTQQELSDLVEQKLHLGLGLITALTPLSRGKSGRIWRLQLTGTQGTFIIGKELEIRRALSDTHLLSSAFDVEKDGEVFRLHGHGWGHGVGLCQIGAAVMAEKGYTYREILSHYYPGAEITTLQS